ncbi:MAG: WG repeat-containing protein [Chitinophagales bacterium]
MKMLIAALLLFPILSSYSQKWEKNYDYVDDCVCGLSKIAKNGKVGYVNKKGVEIIKPQYEDGLTFSEGYTAVKKGTKWLYLDSTGRIITEPVFDDAHNFSNGLASVAKNELFGYINMAGDLVIDYQFSNASIFSEDLASAANRQGLWGYIDKKGVWVIKPTYNFANAFANGEARVMRDDKVFYIDKVNKMVHE